MTHLNSKKHNTKLCTCKDVSKLLPRIEILKADLTEKLNIDKGACFVITEEKDQHLERLSKSCVADGGVITFAFQTVRGRLSELSFKYQNNCYLLHHYTLTNLKSSSLLHVLKTIFESTSVVKVGEHS